MSIYCVDMLARVLGVATANVREVLRKESG